MKKKFWMLRAWDHVLGLKIPTDLVIMTNDGTQGNRVLEQLGVKTDRVRFWINGVDWELFEVMPDKDEARRNLGIDRKWVLLTVSRLIGWKRVERSIRALPEVVKEYSDVILIVVGDGPERAYLEKLTKELGMENHVRFEGAVGRKEIPKYFAAADIFLSLYDWSNVGNPLLEAMMAGKCIVTLNNGDTGKFIENGYNGVLLEYEELQKLPEVIKRLLADEGCRKQLGKNARRFAKEYFWTWQERMDAEVKEVSNLIKQWERRKIG
ncbi:glycosyltransferase family 4 protein [Calderihabitans maritimus]